MWAMAPFRAARRLCSLLAVAGVLGSCDRAPTDPSTRVHDLRPVDSALQVRAGTQSQVKVLVVGDDGSPVPGVSVNWTTSAGYLSRATTPSNAEGIAVNVLTVYGELGDAAMTARAGSAPPLQLSVAIVPGYITKLTVLADSVTFTAQAQQRLVRVVGVDSYGHAVPLKADQIGGYSDFVTVMAKYVIGDTGVVALTSSYGTHRGYATIASNDHGVSTQVLVVLDPVLVGIREISGLDSVNGLAVGERAQLTVTGVDSLGHDIAGLDVVRSGLQLSTSDVNVATTASDGTVTAVAPGKVTIDASAGGVAYHVPITVFPAFDVGTVTTGVELHDPMAYMQTPLGHYLTDAGTIYDLGHYVSAGAPPHPEFVVLRATAPGWKVSWSRSYPTSWVSVVTDPASGVAYLADHLHVIHAIDPAGTDRWTYDYGAIDTGTCRLAGWTDGVAAACRTHVFALNGNGSLAWSATTSDTVRQIIATPTRAVVRMASSVSAIADNGSPAWTVPSSATDMLADANGTVYLITTATCSGVRRRQRRSATWPPSRAIASSCRARSCSPSMRAVAACLAGA